MRRYHYETHDQLREHLDTFLAAYNFAKRLKTLKGLTPYDHPPSKELLSELGYSWAGASFSGNALWLWADHATSPGERVDRQPSRQTVQRCLRFVNEASSLKGFIISAGGGVRTSDAERAQLCS